MAAGCLSVVEGNGLTIPNQMSLIGFDDGLIAKYLHPKLTTVRYPIQIMAEQATQLAFQLAIAAKQPTTHVIEADSSITHMFVPTVVKRLSVAAHS